MTKEIYISSTPHETRLAVVEDDQLAEIYYERENEYTLAGSVYKGKVTRVLPGMQSAFVDIGLERDAFLYITDFAEEQEDGEDYVALIPGQEDATRRSGDGRSPDDQRREAGHQQQNGNQTRREAGNTESVGAQRSSSESGRSSDPSGRPREREESSTGGRRWRGRRGRRRGRSGSGMGHSQASPASAENNREPDDFEGQEQENISSGHSPLESILEGSDETAFRSEMPEIPERQFAQPFRREPSIPSQAALETHVPVQNSPMVLPGESLSKYRNQSGFTSASSEGTADHRGETAGNQPAPAPTPMFHPSTMVEGPLNWDGSDVLPGESLSRRKVRPAEPIPATAAPASPAAEAGLPVELTQQAADETEGPQITREPVFSADAVPNTPATEPLREHVVQEHALREHALQEHPLHEETLPEPAETVHPLASSALESGSETGQNTAEFEPQKASASYRFDPSGPSAYRQNIVEEPETSEPEHEPVLESEHHPVIASASAPVSESEQKQDISSSLNPVQVPPASPEPIATTEPFLNESVSLVTPAPGVSLEQTEAGSVQPDAFEHDLSSADYEAELEEPEASPEDRTARSQHAFDPGLGHLEEETIDEEESEGIFAQAESDDAEYDDLVEETLDVQMDNGLLSELVRDQYIEKRTRYAEEPGKPGEPHELNDLDYEDAHQNTDLESFNDEGGETEIAESDVRADESGSGSVANADVRRSSQREPRRDGRSQRQNGQGNDRRRMRRATAQTTNLPAITDLLKPNQEILVQIAKEPIARKGARITSHIALPGRFIVFMPTVNHVGVSRKISSDEERQRLKRILLSEKGAASGGFIVRTAAATATEEDLRADIRFLLTLWSEMRQRADASKPPALIYHDLSLVERVLRDQVTDNFSAIWVDSEADYERVLRFLNRFEPALVRRVKLYTKETPLFEQFGIQEEINKALRSKVWLKSGGSIVINQTEALVAIDINTGKYVGKTARLEDTILKTNLDSIPEIVRQIRLRDLGGIIVIDFIDMDERKNRNKVMQALEEELKSDRAPSKVLQFNDFGLVVITRKRVKQSLERTLSVPCSTCAGTGMVKGPLTVCNEIYIELRKMHRQFDRSDIMLRVHPEVVKQLKASNGRWLTEMEEMSGKTLIVKSDPTLHPEQFDIH